MVLTVGRVSFPTPACTGIVALNSGCTASSAASTTVVAFVRVVTASFTTIPVLVGSVGRVVVLVVLGRAVGMMFSSMVNIMSGDPTALGSVRIGPFPTRNIIQSAALITCKMLELSDFRAKDSLPTSRRGFCGPPI